MAQEFATGGGQGVIEPMPSRSDLRLYRKAIIGGYNLTPEQRANIVQVAEQVLNAGPCITENGISYRDALAAAKVLLACDKMDIEVEKMAQGPGDTNNTQINIDARGNEALVAEFRKQMTVDERRKLLEQLDGQPGGNGNGKH